MQVFYNFLISVVGFALKGIALFNKKIQLFVSGRKTVFKTLETKLGKTDHTIWIHTASLGEFEQGLPIIEKLKHEFPTHKFLVTFFSPSGYEVKKNSTIADVITYLPLDTKRNAQKFIKMARPSLAFFVKYEFWPNYLTILGQHNIPTFLVSGIFRDNQVFFKWYGAFMRQKLKVFRYFFVQDEHSKQLLNSIGHANVSVSGDTRFDRVSEILDRDNALDFMSDFKAEKTCVVFGSTWPEDEAFIIPFINAYEKEDVVFIIAPHKISETHTKKIREAILKPSIAYSELADRTIENEQVFILDTIGLLTKVYSYADIAYVGGGVGKTGLHNTLEPAVFGIPIIIGKHFQNFKEARDLVDLKGIISINNQEEFIVVLKQLISDIEFRQSTGKINSSYIHKNTGAGDQIIAFVRKL